MSWSRTLVVAVLAVVPPLLLGGATPWTLGTIAVLAGAAAAYVVFASPQSVSWTSTDGAIALAVLWTAMQSIPLPPALFSEVGGRRQIAEGLEFAGLHGVWSPLSLDPGATWEKLVIACAVAASYLVGRSLATTDGRTRVVWLSVLAPLAVAVVSLGHEFVGATAVYGLHAPRHSNPMVLGPLLNANHLGGFLAFGFVLALGLAASAGRGELRWATGVSAVLCGGLALSVGSRGAAMSVVLGIVAIAWVVRRAKRGPETAARAKWVTGIIAVLAMLMVGAYLGLEALIWDFEHGDLSKIELVARAAPVVMEYPVVGIGRGAFGSVFTSLYGATERYTHPENIVVQWAAEWGVLVAVVLFSVFGRDVVRSVGSRHLPVAAAASATGILVLHDMADFALEMPGVVVPVSVLFGALVTTGRRERADESLRAGSRRRELAIVGALTIPIVLLVPGLEGRRSEHFVERLTDLARQPGTDIGPTVEDAARLHPMDARVALYVGYAMSARGETGALRWLNRAMRLAPGWASPHVVAADTLDRRGAVGQALLEVREAEHRHEGSSASVVCRIAARATLDQLRRALPETSAGRRALVDRLVPCIDDSQAAALDEVLIAVDPAASGALVRLAARLDRAGDLPGALAALARALEHDPAFEPGLQLRARLIAHREGPRAGLVSLPPDTSSWSGRLLRAELAAAAGDEAEYERNLSLLRTLAAGNPRRLAEAWTATGQIEEHRGNLGAAMQAYERAHRLHPEGLGPLRPIARLAKQTGQLERERSALRALCERGAEDACRASRSP